MSTSITEKILLNNTLYTDTYYKNTINLTKSISIVSQKEAALYNENITDNYKPLSIDTTDKTSWRYYRHLAGLLHPVDQPVTLISMDNGETITLDRASVRLHRITRTELLKFDLLYKELVDRFPEQELYIKAIIATSDPIGINEIIALPDYSIVSYDATQVEGNEDDLIPELQQRINNYKVTFLIPYYAMSDNLFLTSQYHIFYTFIFKSILAIRLKNAKTLRAHSYQILNYLSSHHYLDKYYHYLTKEQALFLYRNLLYLDNHSGRNDMFKLLIDKLFTDRNISVVNYVHSQSNSLDADNFVNYKFKQRLLNDANLVYAYNDFSLDDIKVKEANLADGNNDELTYNATAIDHKFKNSLFNTLLTKDLETVIVDNTDTVRYKLVPTLIDYWAYLLKTKKMSYLVTVVDPVANEELKLSTKDLFKLFTLTLYKLNGQTLTEFPPYTIGRVFKPTLPSTDDLLATFYRKEYWFTSTIDEIRHNVPAYTNTITSFQFQQFVSSVYQYNIALWLFLTNLDDKDTNGQFELLMDRLNTSEVYTFNDETPEFFLKRIGLDNLLSYDDSALTTLSGAILDNVYDGRLGFLNKYKYIQQALIDVFKKFNSYTVQVIDTYTSTTPLLVGPKDVRVTVSVDAQDKLFTYNAVNLNVEMAYKVKETAEIMVSDSVQTASGQTNSYHIPFGLMNDIESHNVKKVDINLRTIGINSLTNPDWVVSQSSDDDLQFLVFNS